MTTNTIDTEKTTIAPVAVRLHITFFHNKPNPNRASNAGFQYTQSATSRATVIAGGDPNVSTHAYQGILKRELVT